LCLFGLEAVCGCASGQFTTLTIYETPQSFVRLETDPSLGQGTGHSHPADIPTERIAAVLRGIVVQEPLTRLPLYDDLRVSRRHPAFSEAAVMFWAPLLSIALSKATPEEVVTFYHSQRLSGVKREVTSGGVFMDGGDLHILLSNYRSETNFTADIGTADTQDDRLTPLRSLAPQRGALQFEPAEFQRTSDAHGTARLLHWDERELIIDIGRLPVNAHAGPASPAP
jgi:hypothetical protein